MREVSSTQLTLSFETDDIRDYASLKDFMRDECVPSRPRGMKKMEIAGRMDLSPSELTRKLSNNPDDPRNFSIDDLETYIDVTGDREPIYYLCHKFLNRKDDYAAQ